MRAAAAVILAMGVGCMPAPRQKVADAPQPAACVSEAIACAQVCPADRETVSGKNEYPRLLGRDQRPVTCVPVASTAGTVVAEVEVDQQGRVVSSRLPGLEPRCGEAYVMAVYRNAFLPGRQDGRTTKGVAVLSCTQR